MSNRDDDIPDRYRSRGKEAVYRMNSHNEGDGLSYTEQVTRAHRKLIDATGVEWQIRRRRDGEYVQLDKISLLTDPIEHKNDTIEHKTEEHVGPSTKETIYFVTSGPVKNLNATYHELERHIGSFSRISLGDQIVIPGDKLMAILNTKALTKGSLEREFEAQVPDVMDSKSFAKYLQEPPYEGKSK